MDNRLIDLRCEELSELLVKRCTGVVRLRCGEPSRAVVRGLMRFKKLARRRPGNRLCHLAEATTLADEREITKSRARRLLENDAQGGRL